MIEMIAALVPMPAPIHTQDDAGVWILRLRLLQTTQRDRLTDDADDKP